MSDASGTTAYSYDNRDRLILKTVSWNNGPTVSLHYAYDANGNLTNLWSSTAGGVTNVYQYDALNRLTNVVGQASSVSQYSYDAVGNLQTMRYGNGVTNLYQYDSLNRLTNSVWKSNALMLASFYYQLGLTGNRTNLIETVNSTNRTYQWHYDNLYRLTNENISAIGSVGYAYDPVGNRTNRTSSISSLTNQNFTFDTNDWLTTDKYDNNGNTTNASGNFYQYDVMNHLTNVNNGQIVMTYDGDGNRVRKAVGGTTTFYLLDERNPSGYVQVLEEWTSTGTPSLSKVYNYGQDLISQRQVSNGTVSYYGHDGHGSTRLLTSANGTVTDTYTYDACGSLITSTGNTPNNYLFCSEYFDSDLGFYHLRAPREYNPQTGRFTTADSWDGNQEDPQSLHRYVWCQDNPVNRLDPSGHDVIELATSFGIYFALASMPNVIQTGNSITVGKCGPDVTVAVGSVLKEVDDAYKNPANIKNHQKACDALFKKDDTGYVGGGAWAIWFLKNMGRTAEYLPRGLDRSALGTGQCQRTVVYNGQCAYAGAVDYVLFGKINRLCHDSVGGHSESEMDKIIKRYKRAPKWLGGAGGFNEEGKQALCFSHIGYHAGGQSDMELPNCDKSQSLPYPYKPKWLWAGILDK